MQEDTDKKTSVKFLNLYLGRMFSEVIDNCEKHGGNDAIYEQLCSSETTIETREKLADRCREDRER